MADEVKNGLSADPSRIASQWNRSTVADGSWLQKYTLSPLTARDYYLASAIDELGSSTDDSISALSAAISSVSSIHDEYINYISATISGDISGYIDYISGSVIALSGDLKTSADELLRLIDEEHGRADDAETKINNRLDNMEAATDVIDVYGSWDDFTTNSGDLFTLSGITDNDIIKILNDKNSYPNEMFPDAQSVASGHQTYFRWINSAIPESAHIKPLDPTSGYWDFIGYVDPYYTTTEIDEYLNELSATVADNYLSAKGAVHQGKNIVVTENSTKPEITISTSADVEFTTVSSNGFSGTNISGVNQHDTIDNLFGSAYSGAEASAWIYDNSARLDIQAGYGLDVGINDENHLSIGMKQYHCTAGGYDDYSLALGYQSQATAGIRGEAAFAFGYNAKAIGAEAFAAGYDSIANASWSYTMGNAVYAGQQYSVVLGFLNSANASGTYQLGRGLSSDNGGVVLGQWNEPLAGATLIVGDGTGTQIGHDVVRKNALVIKDGLVSGRDFSAGNVSLSSLTNLSALGNGITNTATFNLSAIKLSAGEGIGFKNDTNGVLSISAEGRAYTGENYVKVDNTTKKIGLSGNLINSAQSGQSAYNWITTKSATLQAGQGITFYSAGPNILGISAEGTTYQASSYISTADKKISVTGTLITSAEAGSAASAWVNTNNNKIAYTANFKGSSNVITGYGTSSFAGGISSISVPGSVFTGSNVDFSAGSNIYFTTGTNKLTINLDDNISLGPTNSQIELITESEGEEACIVIRNGNTPLQLYNNYISRSNTSTTWDKVISASNGKFVSAYNQPITIATATTLPTPASMVNGVYYIV